MPRLRLLSIKAPERARFRRDLGALVGIQPPATYGGLRVGAFEEPRQQMLASSRRAKSSGTTQRTNRGLARVQICSALQSTLKHALLWHNNAKRPAGSLQVLQQGFTQERHAIDATYEKNRCRAH